jgi:precorrin-6A/cobalt-precorrin-6A reductase
MGLFWKKKKVEKGKEGKVDVVLIEGTTETAEIVQNLKKLDLTVLVIPTTKFGRESIEETERFKVMDCLITREGLRRMMEEFEVVCLIDASHSFAVEISKSAMVACEKNDITYIRYEEEYIEFKHKNITWVENAAEAAKSCNKLGGNIFLTLGSRNLDTFITAVDDPKRVVPRILPNPEDVKKVIDMGG